MFDLSFWVTLGINAALTLVVGVIAAAIAPVAAAKVADFFYARRVLRSLKQKQNELKNYDLIKAFHEGKKDKQFYYVYLGTLSTMFFIASATCIIALVLTDARGRSDAEPVMFGLFMLLFFTLSLGVLILSSMKYTATNLENFDEYEKRVKERWPDA